MKTVEDVQRMISLTEEVIGASFVEESPYLKMPAGDDSDYFSFPLLTLDKQNFDEELLVGELTEAWEKEGFNVDRRNMGDIVEVIAENDHGATLHLGINGTRFVFMAESEPSPKNNF